MSPNTRTTTTALWIEVALMASAIALVYIFRWEIILWALGG